MKGATLLLALVALSIRDGSFAAEDRPSRVIIAYVFAENDVIDPATIAADELTHINYAFANIQDGVVVEGFARDAENFKVLAGMRRSHPHLKILISVGGWTWSGAFSDAVLTVGSRKRCRRPQSTRCRIWAVPGRPRPASARSSSVVMISAPCRRR